MRRLQSRWRLRPGHATTETSVDEEHPLTQPRGRSSVVGLDIEAGSVAATEVSGNGASRSSRHGDRAARPGRRRARARSTTRCARRRAQGPVRRAQALRRRAPRDRQPARRRADAAPAADRGRRRARGGGPLPAQDHIPMPLDQAVLDWQVDPDRRPARRRPADRRRRRRRAPRDGRRRCSRRSTRRAAAGRHRPLGLRLIRALARRRRRTAADRRRSRADHRRSERRRTPLLPPRRRHQPRGRPRLQLPLHPRARLRDRGHRPVARRRAARPQPRARPPVAHPRRPRGPGRGDRGRPATVAATREALDRGRREARRTSCGARSSTTRAQEDAVPVEDIVVCGPGTAIPGLVERLERELAGAARSAVPGALSQRRRRGRRGA